MTHSDLAAWMEQALPEVLPAFLPQRRWFGGKARPIAKVEFEDAAWLPDAHRASALVVVRVRDTDGEESRYTLIVAFDREAGTLPVVGRVATEGEATWVTEAAADGSVAMALLHGFASVGDRELPMLRGGALRYRDAGDVAARVLRDRPHVRPIGVEQSNTSLRIDGKLAFKLLRKVEHGENPELEIGRFLATRTSFRDTPVLRGSLTYVAASGESATLGVLQDWIESRGDGWSHVLALLRQQSDESTDDALQADAFALGVMTERFHRALATGGGDPAFAPEPVTSADVDIWQRSVVERMARAVGLVSRHLASWEPPTRRLGETFVALSRDPAALSRPPDPGRPSSGFRKIRVHGDYHLGQTLRAADGFVVIDFEGEPARPLAERRAKQPALKDIAGMLRSFVYAVEAASADSPRRGNKLAVARMLRQRFLDGYCATFSDNAPEFAPADPAAVSAWLDFLELDKALYELEYEINNRPTWVYIPLRGLVRLLGGHIDWEEY